MYLHREIRSIATKVFNSSVHSLVYKQKWSKDNDALINYERNLDQLFANQIEVIKIASNLTEFATYFQPTDSRLKKFKYLLILHK